MITETRHDEITGRYAQLIELSVLCDRIGHSHIAADKEECEVCCNLFTLRRQVAREDRIALGIVIRNRLTEERRG